MSKLYNRFKYGLLTTSITLLSFGANAQNNDTISGESYYSSNIVQKNLKSDDFNVEINSSFEKFDDKNHIIRDTSFYQQQENINNEYHITTTTLEISHHNNGITTLDKSKFSMALIDRSGKQIPINFITDDLNKIQPEFSEPNSSKSYNRKLTKLKIDNIRTINNIKKKCLEYGMNEKEIVAIQKYTNSLRTPQKDEHEPVLVTAISKMSYNQKNISYPR